MASSKSSKNKDNNSSTRLPPKTQQKKKTGKPAKVNIKKVLMAEKEKSEQLKNDLESLTGQLVTALESGGVPKERTQDIQKQLLLVYTDDDANASLTEQLQKTISVISEAAKTVETSWSSVHCYPSLDVPNLSSILDDLLTVLCENVSLANKPLQRKLANLQADPKADADVLKGLEDISKQVNGKRKGMLLLLFFTLTIARVLT